jgi:hypothetical protein
VSVSAYVRVVRLEPFVIENVPRRSIAGPVVITLHETKLGPWRPLMVNVQVWPVFRLTGRGTQVLLNSGTGPPRPKICVVVITAEGPRCGG